MARLANNIAFTSAINPSGATPVLTRSQIWNGLLLKIRSAQTFVPAAIESTKVISEAEDPETGNQVTVREVVFKADQRVVKEKVTAFEHCRVEFDQPDGSRVSNVISEGAEGELYMTYIFEWRHPGMDKSEAEALYEKQRNGAKMAVEGTIKAMRALADDGKI